MPIQYILEKLYQGKYINYQESKKIFNLILQKKLSSHKIISLLISMKVRGESPEEIAGAASVLLKNAKPFPKPRYLFSDISGTGGDRSNTINISTTSAIVAASCGLKIIKHGNHSILSQTGSADLLSTFNIKLNIPAKQSLKNLENFGICFLYAPQYHTSLKYLQYIREHLQTPTLFNILGPLINPAKPPLGLIGVYKKELLLPVANAIKILKYHHAAIIVHCDGIDEIGLHAPTQIVEFYKNKIQKYTLTPSDFGLKNQKKEILLGGPPKQNHEIILKLLQGKGKYEHECVVAANVALLLKLFGKENLIKNTHYVLETIHQKKPYKYLLHLKNAQK